MNLRFELVEGLTLLSDALDDPLTDLEAVLSVLTDDLVAAVPGYLGLTITLEVDDSSIILNTLGANEVSVSSSLLLQLLPFGGSTGSILFYSGTAGAFIDLADDARWIFNLVGYPVLDAHLTPVAGPGNVTIHGLTEFSEINQAIGALVEDGMTPEDARAELQLRSFSSGVSLPVVSRELLNSISGPGPPVDAVLDGIGHPATQPVSDDPPPLPGEGIS